MSKKRITCINCGKANQKAYFWTDSPCFSCVAYDKCQEIEDLMAEFKELKVYGY